MHDKILIFLMIALNIGVIACAHSSQTAAPRAAVPMTVIGRGVLADGSGKTPGGMWITDKNQLSSRMPKGSQIPSKAQALPDIDFRDDAVLLIWMGEKPTGGYALELIADKAEIKNRTAWMPVRWIEPGKGAVLTQMITNPYLMIRMAKEGYDTITIIDQNNHAKIVLNVKQR